MSEVSYQHLDEIQDPLCRAKLKGIQESSYALDGEIANITAGISEKRGVVKACDVIAARLLQECPKITKTMEDGEMEHDEAKIRVDQIKRVVKVVADIGTANRTDVIKMQGQIEGVNRAVKVLETKFNGEAAKYERQARMLADDEDETNTEAVEAAASAPEAVEPKPVSKAKKKVGKKVAKKAAAKS